MTVNELWPQCLVRGGPDPSEAKRPERGTRGADAFFLLCVKLGAESQEGPGASPMGGASESHGFLCYCWGFVAVLTSLLLSELGFAVTCNQKPSD